jgi:hypothetical protein
MSSGQNTVLQFGLVSCSAQVWNAAQIINAFWLIAKYQCRQSGGMSWVELINTD